MHRLMRQHREEDRFFRVGGESELLHKANRHWSEMALKAFHDHAVMRTASACEHFINTYARAYMANVLLIHRQGCEFCHRGNDVFGGEASCPSKKIPNERFSEFLATR